MELQPGSVAGLGLLQGIGGEAARQPGGKRPLLCFLHGYDEAGPTDLHTGLLRHGPLRPADGEPAGDLVYLDQGRDHVGSARLAYSDLRVYHWLLAR